MIINEAFNQIIPIVINMDLEKGDNTKIKFQLFEFILCINH